MQRRAHVSTGRYLFIACLAATTTLSTITRASSLDISLLAQRVVDACPVYWEDIKVAIEPESIAGDIWAGAAADRDAFIMFLEAELG
jgi:hypothetical protein